jgi:hypothetical protein
VDEKEILGKLNEYAVPMNKTEFTREEYNRLFPEGKIKTPLGEVKLGEGQFDKLEAKKRKYLLAAMYQTLTDPVLILLENRDGKEAQLYIKSFKNSDGNKKEYVMTIVVNADKQPIAISTGPRKAKQVAHKIKMAGIPLYIRGWQPNSRNRK